jgi:hypothetical protein
VHIADNKFDLLVRGAFAKNCVELGVCEGRRLIHHRPLRFNKRNPSSSISTPARLSASRTASRFLELACTGSLPYPWLLAVGELDASDVRLPRRVLTPHVRMTEKDLVGALRVTVENGAITVTMPGTNYSNLPQW